MYSTKIEPARSEANHPEMAVITGFRAFFIACFKVLLKNCLYSSEHTNVLWVGVVQTADGGERDKGHLYMSLEREREPAGDRGESNSGRN